MAFDTLQKRASAIGIHWPAATMSRIAAAGEYMGIAASSAPPVPPDIPAYQEQRIHIVFPYKKMVRYKNKWSRIHPARRRR